MVKLNIELPDGFLNEEVRCGYTIDRKMKEVWAVELDLYMEFVRVCNKYNIKFCADGGTLLGAIRHNGFIPWDDDLDIAMLRCEYEKLCEVASKEFKYPYFFQTEETDPGSASGHAQLRNCETAGSLVDENKRLKNYRINQGIFIDIFPFDSVPNDSKELGLLYETVCKKRAQYRSILYNKTFFSFEPSRKENGNIDIITTCKRYVRYLEYSIRGLNYKKKYFEFVKDCQKFNYNNETEFVADFCIPIDINRIQRYRADFHDLKNIDFEFVKIPVFKNYDRNLKKLYGENYMKPVKAASEHKGVIFDVEKSYTQYL